ncbi:hypervirulence associated TUDOR domain-containing protein [Hoyosella subflava]|uniref:Hypervirulence associated protein TUDOR domain-containing protein n=1 Tax=Hoyosella subflava (strain DSM 45089 / JCM 17490 / NBRC 109087 / DQS3-9A1) TaxID=443218 RepID=F6EMG4_HOYSD|nr:DUF2945 domain-containing protein [Hoyosella subflava]AEF40324.1 hypothetical protein AS9A_1875 [Hoyosella subflava DQS3-9A1]
MSKSYKAGDMVAWKWGNGTASGEVVRIAPEKTSIQSKGQTITRNGSSDNPAVVITQDDGTRVIKLQSELE